jgi:hypothetical protein
MNTFSSGKMVQPPLIANNSVAALRNVLGDQIISYPLGLLVPLFQRCDCCLWGCFMDSGCKSIKRAQKSLDENHAAYYAIPFIHLFIMRSVNLYKVSTTHRI